MRVSLNEIVSILSNRVGKPFSVPLQEELKKIIHYKRMNYMQQLMEKNPGQRKFYTQQFAVALERVTTENDICGFTTSTKCPILRSKTEIPQPMRSNVAIFDFVGYANFTKAFGISQPEFLIYSKEDKYASQTPKYFYMNNRLYIYNDIKLKYAGIRGLFEDPTSIADCGSSTLCYTDDMPYPAPQDIINAIIRDVLQVELRQEFPEVGEVTADIQKQPLEDGQ